MGRHSIDGRKSTEDKAEQDSGTFSGTLPTPKPERTRTFESDDAGVQGFEYF